MRTFEFARRIEMGYRAETMHASHQGHTLFLLALLCVFSPTYAKDRAPPQANIDAAKKRVRGLYSGEFASKRAQDRLRLSEKLVKVASETSDDPAAKYACLSEAIDLAAMASKIDTALSTLDALTKVFEVNRHVMASRAVVHCGKAAKAKKDQKALVRASLREIDRAISAYETEAARSMEKIADSMARKLGSRWLADNVDLQSERISRLESFLRREKETVTKWIVTPDDPAANTKLGSFICFTMEDWNTGLPLLAKGPVSPLSKLANADLSGPDTSKAQLSLARLWWKYSEEGEKRRRLAMQKRACFWYRRALPSLKGLQNSSPIMAGGHIFATNEGGKSFVFKGSPDKFELVSTNEMNAEVFATPAICDSRIYLRVAERRDGKRQEMIYCIGEG